MKKIFTFVMAAMVASTMFATEKVVTFTPQDFEGKGTNSTGSPVEVTKDGVTVACDKAFGNKYALRCYKDGVVTISATENIYSLEFAFDTYEGRYYNGDLAEFYSVGATSWTATLTSQARFTSIKVTLKEGAAPEPVVEEITPEEALEIGDALEVGATTEATYVVKGYVTFAKEYATTYKNQDFYMASDPANDSESNFYAFRASVAEPGVAVGDLVTVKGKIKKYQHSSGDISIQIEKGQCEIVEKAPTTAVDNVTLNQNITKFFENGQLVIIKNGVKFNAQGQVIE